MATLVPPQRPPATLEHRPQEPALRDAALSPVLEAVGCAAMIVCQGGTVVMANAAGEALLDHDGTTWRERLLQTAAGVAVPGIEATPFPVAGVGPHLLVVVRTTADADGAVRARLLGHRWGLTPRHVDVLERLAWGDSNKTIAEWLGCALRTVEIHVSAVLKRAQVESRAALVARFWTEQLPR